MEKHIVVDFDFFITKEQLLKAVHLPDDPDDVDTKKALEMLDEAIKCARPKFEYCLAAIEEKGENFVVVEGRKIISLLVRQNLDKVHRVILYVATCGTEVEHWSKKYTDMLEAFWADEIKKLLLLKSYEALKETVKKKYFAVSDMSHMSPGSLPQWPISEQEGLLALIGNVKEDVGVVLTDSFLMVPFNSVSGFFFSSETHYENCQLCPMPNCPNRRTKYINDVEENT